MGLYPLQANPWFRFVERIELLDEIEVCNRTCAALPAPLLPRRGPLVDRFHAELAIGVNLNISIVWEVRKRLDQSC